MTVKDILKITVGLIVFCVIVALLIASTYYAKVLNVKWTTNIAQDQINQNQQQAILAQPEALPQQQQQVQALPQSQ